MKSTIQFISAHTMRILAAVAFALLIVVPMVSNADSYRWDADPLTAGIQDGTGVWMTPNWSLIGDGSDDAAWVQSSDAVFGGGTSGTAGPITVASVQAGNITFNQPFSGSYNLTGSTLTFTNLFSVTVNSGGDAIIASNLRGTGFIKDGPGVLSLQTGTSNGYAGPIIVTNGWLTITSAIAKQTIDAGGVIIYTNGTFNYGSGKLGLINSNASITCIGGTVLWGSQETNPLVNFVLNGGLVSNSTTSDRIILVNGSYILESGTIAFTSGVIPGVSTNAKAMVLAGNAGLTKTGPGTAYILGNFNSSALGSSIKNSYLGITTISQGILNIGFDRAIGTNPPVYSPNQLTLDGGTLQITGDGFTWGTNRGVTLTANGGTIDTMPGVTQTIPVPMVGSAGGNFNKAGSGTLTLTGTNSYNGNTTISNGTFALSANGSISNSPVITVAGGATFDVSGVTTPLVLGNSQTLRAGGAASAGTITAAAAAGLALGTTSPLQFSAYNGVNAPLTVAGDGTIQLAAGNVVTVTVARGTPLGAGDYKLISTNGAGGSVSGVAPTAVTVNGDGLTAGATASLAINSAELFLHVTGGSSVNPNATNIVSSVAGGNLTLTWPSDHTGWTLQTQTNPLNVGLKTNWFDVTGSAATNQVVLPVGTANGSVFFRLRYP